MNFNAHSISKSTLQKLIRKAGVTRILGLMYEELRGCISIYLERTLEIATEVKEMSCTIKKQDLPESLFREQLELSPNIFATIVREGLTRFRTERALGPQGFEITEKAIKRLQYLCEEYLLLILQNAYEITKAKKRKTIFPKDLILARYNLGEKI